MKALAALAFACVALGLAPAAAAPPKISDLADELQRIQIRMAEGDKTAYAEQLKQLKAMAAAIAGAAPETWKSEREADGLVVYLLSGGWSAELAALLSGEAIVDSRRALARGAAAYIAGRSAEAAELMNKIDPAELSPRLAGQVAFARSVLATKRDPKAALDLLDRARLIAPGTLLEEAALRREIALLAQARDPRAAMLIRQYAARFSASLYAGDFFRDLARLAAEFDLADKAGGLERLARALEPLPVDAKRAFWLALAKTLTIAVRPTPAEAAAKEVLRYVRSDSEEGLRARLYHDAGRLLAGEYESAAADLQALPPSKLDRSDAALLTSVRSVAAQLRAAPSSGAVAAQSEEPGRGAGAAGAIGLAEAALQRTGDLAEAENR